MRSGLWESEIAGISWTWLAAGVSGWVAEGEPDGAGVLVGAVVGGCADVFGEGTAAF
jgi:hypothetical protein